MGIKLVSKAVGPWPMNTYLIVCEETGDSAIVDPGRDVGEILAMAEGTKVQMILITHGHPDHVGAMLEVKRATDAPIYMHPADAERFNLGYDVPLDDGDRLKVGGCVIQAVHTPGHTPGMTSFILGESLEEANPRVIVGDTIFVGGPGKTQTPEDFALTMHTMQFKVFEWPDETTFYPGHGSSGTIGQERRAFEEFLRRGWVKDLHGDVTWAE